MVPRKKTFIRVEQNMLTLTDILLLSGAFLFVVAFQGFRAWPIWESFLKGGTLITVFIIVFILIFGTNRSLWRYAEVAEYRNLLHAHALGFFLFILLNEFIFKIETSYLFSSYAVFTGLLGSVYIRVISKTFFTRTQKKQKGKEEKTKVKSERYLAIIGAGSAGVALQEELNRDPKSPYKIWGFFDDSPQKQGLTINGTPIRGTIDQLPEIIKKSPVYDVILAIPSLDIQRRREIIAICSKLQCRLRIMPHTLLTIERGETGLAASIREVKVEDLLGRTTVYFEKNELDTLIKGKTVLVSGGAGSIGSELCRQIAGAGVKKLIIFDINENSSYMLYRELKHLLGNKLYIVVEIGSVADERRVNDLFQKYRPEVVFHAAAHKHVPLMEECPYEAVRNNIFGTYHLLTAAKEACCKKFVLISTDKAINPTNVMGATKRYCEMMMQAVSKESDCKTDFVSVRFGNVLGSHGSVIPLFQMQIAHGGPVTVTDKRMTRYFMTIPEAAGLVIKAAALAQRSDTFILDMGAPMKILDLAENLIRLSGFEPYEEIQILETGVRPGEKLYEELLINDNKHVATSEAKIFVEKNLGTGSRPMIEELKQFHVAVDTADNTKAVELLRQFVPNFKTPEEVNGAVTSANGLCAKDEAADKNGQEKAE